MILRIRETSRCDGKKRKRREKGIKLEREKSERSFKNRFYYILGRNNFPRKNPEIHGEGGTNDPRTDLQKYQDQTIQRRFVEHWWVLRILRRPEFGIAATLP